MAKDLQVGDVVRYKIGQGTFEAAVKNLQGAGKDVIAFLDHGCRPITRKASKLRRVYRAPTESTGASANTAAA